MEKKTRFEETLVVRERNWALLGVTLLPAVVAPILAADRAGIPLAIVLVIASFVVLLVTARKNPLPVLTDARVVVTTAGMRVGDRAIPRRALRAAWLTPRPDGTFVVRVRARRRLPIDLAVGDVEQGRRFLRALGFDASQRVANFVAASPVQAMPFFPLPAFAAVVGLFVLLVRLLGPSAMTSHPLMALLPLGIAWCAFFILAAIPARVAVGADGVLLAWLGWTRFLPLSAIRNVEEHARGGARLTLASGKHVWLPIGGHHWHRDRSAAVVERIREAMAEHARGTVDATASVLARHDRPILEWLRDLRAVGSGATADLRSAPVVPAHLWRIVESHAADPETRAAAAVALGPQIDDAGKARLRVAVETVADERLRLAVDAVASGDEGAIEAALSEVAPVARR